MEQPSGMDRLSDFELEIVYYACCRGGNAEKRDEAYQLLFARGRFNHGLKLCA